ARCWGIRDYGNLGDGEVDGSTATTATTVLTGVGGPPLANVVAVSVGGYFSCALIANGTVNCWGDNSNSELGNGSGASQSNFPVQVTRNAGGPLTGVTAISAGESHVCARRTNGTVECWGQNLFGQLGDGSNTPRNRSITVTGLTNATSVSSGFAFTCALLADTTVRCWGHNDTGQLGDGSDPTLVPYKPLPVAVKDLSNATLSAVASIDVGKKTACALRVDTYVKCWGEGTYGNLGRADLSDWNLAVSVIAANGLPIEGVASIDVGNVNACAVMTNSSVKCWGANGKGQIGDGTIGGGPAGRPFARPIPTTVVNLLIVTPIVAPAPVVALLRATLDPSGGSCVDGIAHTEIWTASFLGYRYLPGASDCTRNGFAFAGWANTTTPTIVRTFPVLVDPSDGALRSFVAENITLVAVWNPLPATPKFFIGISNWLCTNCGVLLAWDTPAGNPTVAVTNASSTNVCANTTITVGPWTLCHVKTGRPGTYTLTSSNTGRSSQPITTTVG
ncbi:MAG: hypothetical protein FGM45_02835, partial [Actinobacteria bacterium]|nr:hypothetical protein [Actinomycetota bacterium]